MTKELTTVSNNEMLHTLRDTVAPGLTDSEFKLFAEICRATGLNPATKEIWAIKAGGRLQLMTGINGFLRIANSHPQFDGMETSFEWDGKQLVSCTVKVHRKDRKYPSVATAYWNEYSKPTPVWKQMPTVMLSKCAKSLAIREAFIQELGGLYTAEEMPQEFQASKSAMHKPIEIDGKTEYVNEATGEIDDLPAWDQAHKSPVQRPKAKTTRYDISGLSDAAKGKAIKYLTDCICTEIEPNIWQCPIRLEKLTQCVIEDENEKEKES